MENEVRQIAHYSTASRFLQLFDGKSSQITKFDERHGSHFSPSIIIWGKISPLNFQNGYLGSQTWVLGLISSYNYKNDRFSPQILYFGLISSVNYQSAFDFYSFDFYFQLNFVYSKKNFIF